MLNALRASLGDLATANDEEDGEDNEDGEEDTELGKLSQNDQPGWVVATISNTGQQSMPNLRQKQMRLDEVSQPRWGDVADYVSERCMMYGMAELNVPAVVNPQTDQIAAAPVPTTFGELMQTHHVVPGQLQMPQKTSQPGSSHMRLGSKLPLSHKRIATVPPDSAPNTSPIQKLTSVEPVSFYSCM